MTSTSFNVGLNDNTRLSSRVLRPPGGGHTDIFGGEPEPPRTGRRMAPNPATAAAAAPEEAAKPTSPETPEQNGQANCEAPQELQIPDVTTSNPTSEKTQPQNQPQNPPQNSEQPNRRVRVPPGGFSSGLW